MKRKQKVQGVLHPVEMFLGPEYIERKRSEGWLPAIEGAENDFITPSIIARVGLATLYNNMVLTGLVSRDYDSEFSGKQGDTITIRKPAVFTAKEFNRSTGIELQDIDEDSMPVKLDHIADVSFAVTTEELTLTVDNFSERLLTPAMMAIVEALDLALADELIDAATGPGGGGTATMNSKGHEAFNEARQYLTRNKAPLTDRNGVVSPEGTTELLEDELVVTANQSGTTDALRNANVGRIYGIDTYESGTFGYGPGDAGSADGVAFHRTAVTLASRTLQAPNGVSPAQVAIENFRGLGLRVVQDYDIKYKQDVVSVDFLYGVAATRPEFAVALDFGQGS